MVIVDTGACNLIEKHLARGFLSRMLDLQAPEPLFDIMVTAATDAAVAVTSVAAQLQQLQFLLHLVACPPHHPEVL